MTWKFRKESFGGISFSEKFGATIFIGKKWLRFLGVKENFNSEEKNYLSAPLFVHFHLTNYCSKNCEFCYSNSGPNGKEFLSLSEIKKIIDILAEMKIFSIAFGGGEPFSRKDLFEIANYCRKKGISPTVTTNGILIDEEKARLSKVFSVVHISVDLENDYWQKAISLLKKEKVRLGINFVVNKKTFPFLEEISKYAQKEKIKEVLFLRCKPIGRGREVYPKLKLSFEENVKFFPLLKKLARKHKIKPMIDCSFLPMIYYHRPSKKLLDFFSFEGCVGGNYFVAIDSQGNLKNCSFSEEIAGKAIEIKSLWNDSPVFSAFRNWKNSAQSPCKDCEFLDYCQGGCHVVAKELTQSYFLPDPECPFVMEFNQKA